MEHDGLDRLLSQVSPQGAVTMKLDLAGRRETFQISGQPAVAYTFDDASRLTQLQQGATVVAMVYDDADRRTQLALPGGIEINYGYDSVDRLTTVLYERGATVLGNLAYVYNADSLRVGVTGTWARVAMPAAIERG